MPLQELEAQKKSCAAIMASKGRLIAEFQMELKAKDEEYVKALQKQRDEVEDVLKRMTEQFNELRTSYEDELEHIEDAFLVVRRPSPRVVAASATAPGIGSSSKNFVGCSARVGNCCLGARVDFFASSFHRARVRCCCCACPLSVCCRSERSCSLRTQRRWMVCSKSVGPWSGSLSRRRWPRRSSTRRR
jgi:hypothetical protein